MINPSPSQEQIGRPGTSGKAARLQQTAVAISALLSLEALFAAMAYLGDLKLHVIGFIVLALAAGMVYCLALYALEHSQPSPAAFWIILAGALLFRLTLLPLPPSLSTDLYRYQWEGRVQKAGWNPYLIAPVDPRLEALRDQGLRNPGLRNPGWTVMPVPELPAVYPPLSELVFSATARWTSRRSAAIVPGAIAFKTPFFLADLLAVALLATWLRSTGGQNHQLAVYAWSPLVIVEFAASGHNDALAIAALVLALSIIRWRPGVSTVALTAGALAKLFPIALLPAALRRAGWPRRWQGWAAASASAGLVLLCAWPYRSAAPQLPQTFRQYRAIFQGYNASLYAALRWLVHRPLVAERIGEGVVAALVLWSALPDEENSGAGAGTGRKRSVTLWPISMMRLKMMGQKKIGLKKMGATSDPLRAAFWIIGAILLFAPNGYSWYFTWIVPLLCFFPEPAWLLLTVLQFLSYNVLIAYQITGVWRFDPLMQWLTYAPFYALLLGTFLVKLWRGRWRKHRAHGAAVAAPEQEPA